MKNDLVDDFGSNPRASETDSRIVLSAPCNFA
jgi:hypothetical protein